MKMDVVIPTMWKSASLTDCLEKYCSVDSINKIIIVDNNHRDRPRNNVLSHERIEFVSYGRNIYVNPAWNEGYYRSSADILCLLNDDIFVEPSVFDFVANLDFKNIDIIGVHLRGSIDNYHIVDHPDGEEKLIKMRVDKSQPIGGQAYAFGVCMFIKSTSYRVIPSLYKIWYGDDWLIQRANNIYALKTNKIHGEISKTIVDETKNRNSDIQRRIDLDSANVYRYNHFMNGKNWKLVSDTYIKSI